MSEGALIPRPLPSEQAGDEGTGVSQDHRSIKYVHPEHRDIGEATSHVRNIEDKLTSPHVSPEVTVPLPESKLPTLLSALADVADKMGAEVSNKSELLQAGRTVDTCDGFTGRAADTVLRGTLHYVRQISRQAPGSSCDDPTESLSEEQETDSGGESGCAFVSLADEDLRRERDNIRHFLILLAGVWASLRSMLQTHQDLPAGLPPSLAQDVVVNALEDLMNLAALATDDRRSDSEGRQCELTRQSHAPLCSDLWQSLPVGSSGGRRLQPWSPILEVLWWSCISIVRAENILLTCIGGTTAKKHNSSRPCCAAHPSKKQVQRSRRAAISVATAIVKEYHSWGVGEDLSHVLLLDLLEYAASSARPPHVVTTSPGYHPMNFCRLVGYLLRCSTLALDAEKSPI